MRVHHLRQQRVCRDGRPHSRPDGGIDVPGLDRAALGRRTL